MCFTGQCSVYKSRALQHSHAYKTGGYHYCYSKFIKSIRHRHHFLVHFRLFCPCKIILSHISVPVRWKDQIRTATCRPHAGHTSICDVTVMLKIRHHVAFQPIQDFLEVFFMVSQYKMRYLVVNKKNNSMFVWRSDRKIRRHHSASLVMPISEHRDDFF